MVAEDNGQRDGNSYFLLHELGKSLAIGGLGSTGRLYAQFAKDIREGTKLTPDFAHALVTISFDAIEHLHVQEWHRN